MTSKICVAFKVKSGNLEENKVKIDRFLEKNPDLIELRWDYIDNVENLTEDFIKGLTDYVQASVPAISTFRASSEGGNKQINEEARFELIEKLISAQPQYLDVEMNIDRIFLRKVCQSSFGKKIKILFSYHDFAKTPSIEEAINIVQDFLKGLASVTTMTTDKTGSFIYKIIFKANIFEDNLVPIKLCRYFTKLGEDRNIVSFCMGDVGIFSRIICIKAGSYLTFASVEEGTAPGQIHIDTMKEILDDIFNYQ